MATATKNAPSTTTTHRHATANDRPANKENSQPEKKGVGRPKSGAKKVDNSYPHSAPLTSVPTDWDGAKHKRLTKKDFAGTPEGQKAFSDWKAQNPKVRNYHPATLIVDESGAPILKDGKPQVRDDLEVWPDGLKIETDFVGAGGYILPRAKNFVDPLVFQQAMLAAAQNTFERLQKKVAKLSAMTREERIASVANAATTDKLIGKVADLDTTGLEPEVAELFAAFQAQLREKGLA